MVDFLRKDLETGRFEVLVDAGLFPPHVAMKAAYGLLDKGYFHFRSEGASLVVQASLKPGVKSSPEALCGEFSDELLNVALRDRLERDNKVIREAVVTAAIGYSLDTKNFVSVPQAEPQNRQIDFDKDIDEILKEIENDPELKIDQAEIDKILKEIEAESADTAVRPAIVTLDLNKVADAKKKFQAGK